MVQIHELDLTVGDVFHVGERTITVVDIDKGEVTFRVDDGESTFCLGDHESQDDDRAIDLDDKISGPLPR